MTRYEGYSPNYNYFYCPILNYSSLEEFRKRYSGAAYPPNIIMLYLRTLGTKHA